MTENKICSNCKKGFVIASEDFAFYERIKVPPPTFCPVCRVQRRIMWRCERSLYRRPCDLCGMNIVSVYSTAPAKSADADRGAGKPKYKVYCRECFHGDKWDPKTFGRDYDFLRPFFEQLKELQLAVPRQFAFAFQNVNSDYTNGSAFNKNCYLIFVSDHNEDSQYSYSIFDCMNSSDLLNCNECELCYECITCKKCYRVGYSQDCSNSQDLLFCHNLANCHDCVGSANLRNRSHCIFNEQYSKEEYEKKIAEFKLNTREGLEAFLPRAREFWSGFPQKFIHGFQNQKITGDYIFNSKNCERCFDSEQLEDCKYINHGNKAKFCYDAYVCVDNGEYSLEFVGGIGARNVKFSAWPFTSFDCDYIDSCENSNNLFGCISMKKSQYCILNKQYSKEEYEEMRAKIIEQMNVMPYVDTKRRTYKYGEFFPADLCPFAYNEAVVQEYFPSSKDVVLAEGYRWKDPEERGYDITMRSGDVPHSIDGVGDEILKEIIGCQDAGTCNHGCTSAFRLTPAELQLYRRLSIPVPKHCFSCRHFARLERKNPTKLQHRKCMCNNLTQPLLGKERGGEVYKNTAKHFHGDGPCSNEFETTYPAERSDIVYCEACYQAEVA